MYVYCGPKMIPIPAASCRGRIVQYFANPISNPIVDYAGGRVQWQALLITVRYWAAYCMVCIELARQIIIGKKGREGNGL